MLSINISPRFHWLKTVLFFSIGVLLDSIWGLVFISIGLGVAAARMNVPVTDIVTQPDGAFLLGLSVFSVLLLRLLSEVFHRLMPNNEND